MSQSERDFRIEYIEFLTTNVARTKTFYSDVFGWVFTDYGPDYTSFSDGRLGGGFAKSEGLTNALLDPRCFPRTVDPLRKS